MYLGTEDSPDIIEKLTGWGKQQNRQTECIALGIYDKLSYIITCHRHWPVENVNCLTTVNDLRRLHMTQSANHDIIMPKMLKFQPFCNCKILPNYTKDKWYHFSIPKNFHETLATIYFRIYAIWPLVRN